METFGRTFLFIGPLVIIMLGVTLTAVLAPLNTGRRRGWVLVGGPALTLLLTVAVTWLVIVGIDPGLGSGFRLGGAAIGVYLVALGGYYPALGLIAWRARRRRPPPRVDPSVGG